jgi:hypothetical protein
MVSRDAKCQDHARHEAKPCPELLWDGNLPPFAKNCRIHDLLSFLGMWKVYQKYVSHCNPGAAVAFLAIKTIKTVTPVSLSMFFMFSMAIHLHSYANSSF